MKKLLATVLLLMLAVSMTACGGATNTDDTEVKQVSIMTPYISSVTTNQMAELMKAQMEEKGYEVNIVDTKGDVAELASRMEDVITAQVDAIVLISTDPNLVETQVQRAAEAGIYVLGCDSGFIEGMEVNATSDNYAMGEEITKYLFEKMGNEGSVIALTHRPHPGAALRCEAFDAVLAETPNVNLLVEQHVDVPNPIENARQTVENLLLANPEKDSITAIWCAWDEPAIGAAQALQAAGRDEVMVVGVDGNSQAVEIIEADGNIIATISQNFEGMATIVTDTLANIFNGVEIEKGDQYAPATIIE